MKQGHDVRKDKQRVTDKLSELRAQSVCVVVFQCQGAAVVLRLCRVLLYFW